ncbi:Cia2 [Giardia muris]|uniref:Cia2 n=1 Tax=Giardia muris TaxID=5742 RepID=A0A4Z1SP38_GIAMU|nr:Cia2 [Giardia muris]|eukprot:TNJ26625.1 Cia2 [Giardia muris]
MRTVTGPFGRRGGEEAGREPITAEEVYELIRAVRDPEHPTMTLEDLRVVCLGDTWVDDAASTAVVVYTPTTPGCSLGSVLGLSLKIKLVRCLPRRFRVRVRCRPGAHAEAASLGKQVNDKERALAAMTNPGVAAVVDAVTAPACTP